MTENELFDKMVNLELDNMAHKENVKSAKKEAKDLGFESKEIGIIQACAKVHVANTFEEKSAADAEFDDTYRRLTGYDN